MCMLLVFHLQMLHHSSVQHEPHLSNNQPFANLFPPQMRSFRIGLNFNGYNWFVIDYSPEYFTKFLGVSYRITSKSKLLFNLGLNLL